MDMRQQNIQDLDSKENIYLPNHFLPLWMGKMLDIIQLSMHQFYTRIARNYLATRMGIRDWKQQKQEDKLAYYPCISLIQETWAAWFLVRGER